MKVKEGDKLPDAKVFVLEKDPKEVSIKKLYKMIKQFYLVYPGPLHQHVQPNICQDLL